MGNKNDPAAASSQQPFSFQGPLFSSTDNARSRIAAGLCVLFIWMLAELTPATPSKADVEMCTSFVC